MLSVQEVIVLAYHDDFISVGTKEMEAGAQLTKNPDYAVYVRMVRGVEGQQLLIGAEDGETIKNGEVIGEFRGFTFGCEH